MAKNSIVRKALVRVHIRQLAAPLVIPDLCAAQNPKLGAFHTCLTQISPRD